MHLVDQVYLVAATTGCILHVFEQLAGIINTGALSRIDLDQVNKAPFRDLAACSTFTAGFGSHADFAVQRLGKDASNRGLADTACAGKQVGMMQAVFIKTIDQCTLDMLLPNQFFKIGWTPFSRKNLVAHRLITIPFICMRNILYVYAPGGEVHGADYCRVQS